MKISFFFVKRILYSDQELVKVLPLNKNVKNSDVFGTFHWVWHTAIDLLPNCGKVAEILFN